MRVKSNGHVRRTEPEWQEIVRKFGKSGLSIQEFCRRERLVLSTFKRWQQRVSDKPATRFVDLTPEPKTVPTPSWELDVNLPNGVRLQFRG